MQNPLLDSDVQKFILAHAETDVSKLALLKNPFPELEFREVMNQILARYKAKHKLPNWYNTPGILYPAKISIEQASSEITARYKASLVTGKSLIDLTGGFGVDDFYFSKNMDEVVHCELGAALSEAVAHNFQILHANGINCLIGDSAQALKDSGRKFDWIYIDPSRRNDTKGKVFLLKDCLPNVPLLLDFYFSYSDNIMIKTAPILDLSAGMEELDYVKSVHIVAVNNEVKELLWILEKGYSAAPEINALNLNGEKVDAFRFIWGDKMEAGYGLPSEFLYEPNAAIMKSGAFETIGIVYQVQKLQHNSHLYTSDSLVENFPGRRFRIEQQFAYNKKSMNHFLYAKKANVTVRNFPESVEMVRKKWKISDGGSVYCFFTTNISNEKIVLLCSKI